MEAVAYILLAFRLFVQTARLYSIFALQGLRLVSKLAPVAGVVRSSKSPIGFLFEDLNSARNQLCFAALVLRLVCDT
jgi:hypothetical protein